MGDKDIIDRIKYDYGVIRVSGKYLVDIIMRLLRGTTHFHINMHQLCGSTTPHNATAIHSCNKWLGILAIQVTVVRRTNRKTTRIRQRTLLEPPTSLQLICAVVSRFSIVVTIVRREWLSIVVRSKRIT